MLLEEGEEPFVSLMTKGKESMSVDCTCKYGTQRVWSAMKGDDGTSG